MRSLLVIAWLSVSGCESEPERLLKPDVFPAELTIEASTATPNRLCTLVGSEGRPIELMIKGDVAYSEDDSSGQWQIVAPEAWSAAAVSSRFEMGLGGFSTHLWRTSDGDMSARIEWCDECPRDGTDSTIKVYDSSFSVFAGVCRPIETESQGSDTPS